MVCSNPYAANYLDYKWYDNSTNSNTGVQEMDRLLQKRANCYGFAMRFTYSGNYLPIIFSEQHRDGYLQQPGEFSIKHISSTEYPSNYDKLAYLYQQEIMENLSISAPFIMNMVQNDLLKFGFNVTYPGSQYTSSSQIPFETYENKRLVLLVVGLSDFHFYMRNSNGTWTHKPGTTKARNKCMGECGSPTLLTNSNILSHCHEGGYTKEYRFFFVDKPSTIDYFHGDGTASSCENSTPCVLGDVAGSDFEDSKGITLSQENITTINGMIDYNYDNDCFSFDSPVTKTYSFDISTLKNGSSYSHSLSIEIVAKEGRTVLYSNSNFSGNTTITLNLQKGEIYYIRVCANNNSFDYWRQYKISIS